MAPEIGGDYSESPTAARAGTIASRSSVVPARADAIELIGEMQGSGYRKPPALVRRGDGQVLQLTPLVYRVLQAIDGSSTVEEITATVSQASGRSLTSAQVSKLINEHLLPLGLLRLADGSQPEVKRANPLLSMRLRMSVSDPATTRRITRPFAALFTPVVVAIVLAAFAFVAWWVLFVKGFASATHDAFASPGLLLLVFVVTLLSAGFHEFGHAAAATRGGAAPGTMGAGLYLVWPAFYTDVTDSYRLGRGGRLRTDLGGLYFNAIVAVAIFGVWWATSFDALLLVIATQLVVMVQQLAPIVRFDGYHVLADATGVPDLFQRIKPTLLGLLPWRWGHPENHVLKPWARAVITLWVLLVVPLLVIMLVVLVISLPRIVGTAIHAIGSRSEEVAAQWGAADFVAVAAGALGILALALPVAGIAYVLVRLVRQVTTATWRSTSGRPVARTLAGVVAASIVAGLAFAWWPSAERYRPVEGWESGTLAAALSGLAPGGPELVEGTTRETVALWTDGDVPTREEPRLSTVLIPRDSDAPAWVFPFSKPDTAGEGDTQSLAVNTEDGTVVYDVAFALVWADGSEPVDTTNEAYAFASCAECAAVAISFQVVLIVGQADVVVPQNIAAAVTYECIECLTYALANQLVVTLDGPLSDEAMARLEELWAEIAAYGETITDRDLSEVQAALEEFKARILEVIEADKGDVDASTPAPEAPATPEPTAPAEEPVAPPAEEPAPQPETEPAPAEPEPEPTPVAPSEPEPTPAP